MEELVVVTGGNGGLGLELVKLFSKKYKVLVIARTKKTELDGVMYEYGSIADEKFIKAVYEKYSEQFNIKFLINNAGVGCFGDPEQNDMGKIQKVLEASLVGLILNTTYALPLMKRADGGGSKTRKIVNILSSASLKGNANESLYCAAKWGGRGYTESLKTTFKGTNIKVVAVYPGGMNTDFWSDNRDYVPEEKSAKWMNPTEVAKIIFENVINEKLSVAELVIERV